MVRHKAAGLYFRRPAQRIGAIRYLHRPRWIGCQKAPFFIGKWVWNKPESRRDPKTGPRRRFPKPESEWIVNHDESPRIVSQGPWEAVRQQHQIVTRARHSNYGKKGFSKNQKSHQKFYPAHLLAGAMNCGACGAGIIQVSGKSGGYNWCANARKNSCGNKVIVRRSLVEKVVINEIRRLISSPEQIRYVLEKFESEIANLYSDIPDSICQKEAELRAEEKRLANYINFIGESNTSRTLNEALLESEKKVDALQAEIDGMRQMRDKIFQAPSIEWIAERISQFRELLETNTNDSALVLHNLLGPIILEAKYPDIGKPCYLAYTSIEYACNY